MILLFSLFQLKHLICDYFLQLPYQYLNKGKYGHPGGVLHVGIHWWGSMICMTPYWDTWFVFLLVGELIVHYHTDWAKIYICNKFDWKPTNSDYYWWMLGIDQFIHHMTYIVMIYFMLKPY
jgi:Protein of unknown function (DUF3307)